MAAPEHFDYISLGSGEAGKYIAWMLSSQHGKRCAVIEERYVGGSCPNIACLPSKNFVHSAHAAHLAHQAASYGLNATKSSDFKTQMAAVVARKASMVQGLVDMHLGKFADTHVEFLRGRGVFTGPKTINVDGRTLTGDVVVICTGSRAFVDPAVPGLLESQPLTHIELLELQALPDHLIVIGGGYVGLEFAQVYVRFGARVTVVQRQPQVLPNEDADVAEALTAILEREGVRFLLSSTAVKVAGRSGDEVIVTASSTDSAGKKTLEDIRGSHILVAAGRAPNTSGIGLDEADIRLTPTGHVAVDEQLRTSVPDVFAVGDCAGSPHFTHVGYDDFRLVYASLTGRPRAGGTTGRQVPSVLFTAPELAHVGLREREARATGIAYRLARLPMGAFLRTRTLGLEADGFAKALVEADGDRILGFTALGPGAGELLPAVQLAMKLGIAYGELADLVIVHPTMCEGLVSLFSGVPSRQG